MNELLLATGPTGGTGMATGTATVRDQAQPAASAEGSPSFGQHLERAVKDSPKSKDARTHKNGVKERPGGDRTESHEDESTAQLVVGPQTATNQPPDPAYSTESVTVPALFAVQDGTMGAGQTPARVPDTQEQLEVNGPHHGSPGLTRSASARQGSLVDLDADSAEVAVVDEVMKAAAESGVPVAARPRAAEQVQLNDELGSPPVGPALTGNEDRADFTQSGSKIDVTSELSLPADSARNPVGVEPGPAGALLDTFGATDQAVSATHASRPGDGPVSVEPAKSSEPTMAPPTEQAVVVPVPTPAADELSGRGTSVGAMADAQEVNVRDVRDLFDRLVDQSRVQNLDKSTIWQLRIQEPDLGRIEVTLDWKHDTLHASFSGHASTGADFTSQVLRPLRALLNEQGIAFGDLSWHGQDNGAGPGQRDSSSEPVQATTPAAHTSTTGRRVAAQVTTARLDVLA